MTLCIVGAGEMGRWLARTVDATVAFADTDAAAAEDAATAVGERARAVPIDTDESFEAVCLAVPMDAVADAVAAWADRAESAMLDLSGVMASPVEAMAEHCSTLERASLHPLFAPPRGPGNVAAVVSESGPVLEGLLEALRDAGNTVFETTPAEHDRAMETVQARAHTAVLAYALAAEDVREEFHTPVSVGLQDLAETVTAGSPGVYADIQATFDGADDVAAAARDLADADDQAFESLYEQAREAVGGESRVEGETAAETAGESGGDLS